MAISPLQDPHLRDVPTVDGYKVLEPAVLVEKLPEGGMAAVYRGMHLDLKVEVAVKVLKRSGESQYSPQAVARFRQEAEQAARLNDPNLVRIYDFPANRLGLLYLVMEYVDGETLESRIHRKGRLHPHEAATIALLATRGLHTAHGEGVIHRDIKPPNILLSKKGKVKVTDLGIAKAQDSAAMGMTQEITLLGTPQYMSPELWRGARYASAASDVFAVGATLAFMLTGRHVLDGQDAQEIMHRALTEGFPDISKIAADIPPALVEIVRLCTLSDARQRITVDDLLGRLGTVIQNYGGEFALVDPQAGATVQPLSPTRFPSRADLEVIRKKIDEIDAAHAEPKPVPRTLVVTDDPSTTAAAMQAFLGETHEEKAPVPRTPPPPPAPRPVPQQTYRPPSQQQPPPATLPAQPTARPARPAAQGPVQRGYAQAPHLAPAQVYYGARQRQAKKKSGIGGALFVLLLLGLIAGGAVLAVQEGWFAQLQDYLSRNDPPSTQPTTQPSTLPATGPATRLVVDATTRPNATATTGPALASSTTQPATRPSNPLAQGDTKIVPPDRPLEPPIKPATGPVVVTPATRPDNPLKQPTEVATTKPVGPESRPVVATSQPASPDSRPVAVATTQPATPDTKPTTPPVAMPQPYDAAKQALNEEAGRGSWSTALARLAELRRLAGLETRTADFTATADKVLSVFRAEQAVLSQRRDKFPNLYSLVQPAYAEGSSVAALLMAETLLDYDGTGASRKLRAVDGDKGFADAVRYLQQVKPQSPLALTARQYLFEARVRQLEHLAARKDWPGLINWLSEIPVAELVRMKEAGQPAPYTQAMQTVASVLHRLWVENKDLAERQRIVRDPRPLTVFADAGNAAAALLLAESLMRYQGQGAGRRMISMDTDGSYGRIIALCERARGASDADIAAAASAYLYDACSAGVGDAVARQSWGQAVDALAKGLAPLKGEQLAGWKALAETTLMSFRTATGDLEKRRESLPELANQLEPLSTAGVHAALLLQAERFMTFDNAAPPRLSPLAGDPEFRLTLELLAKVIESPATPVDVRSAALYRQWDVYAYYARKSLDDKRADRTLDKLKLVAKCDATETRNADYVALVDELWSATDPKVAWWRVTLGEDLMGIKENERGTRSVSEARPAMLGIVRSVLLKTRESTDPRSRARANALLGELTLASLNGKPSEAYGFFKDGCRVERQGELGDPIALMGLALFWSLNDLELRQANYADPSFDELRQVDAKQRTLKTLALYREAARSTDKYANFLAGQYTWLALTPSPANTQLAETYLKAAIDRGHERAKSYLQVVRSGGR